VRKDESDAFTANPKLATTLRDKRVDRRVIAGTQSDY
jgi:hypothetical protein